MLEWRLSLDEQFQNFQILAQRNLSSNKMRYFNNSLSSWIQLTPLVANKYSFPLLYTFGFSSTSLNFNFIFVIKSHALRVIRANAFKTEFRCYIDENYFPLMMKESGKFASKVSRWWKRNQQSPIHRWFTHDYLTGIAAAGKTPIWFAPVLRLSARRLLPSKFPNDSGKPSSSPTLNPFVLDRKKC